MIWCSEGWRKGDERVRKTIKILINRHPNYTNTLNKSLVPFPGLLDMLMPLVLIICHIKDVNTKKCYPHYSRVNWWVTHFHQETKLYSLFQTNFMVLFKIRASWPLSFSSDSQCLAWWNIGSWYFAMISCINHQRGAWRILIKSFTDEPQLHLKVCDCRVQFDMLYDPYS